MKKTLTLLLLLGAALPLSSQEKQEFGFMLRAGNYAIPHQKTLPGYNQGAGNSQLNIQQKAGESYSLGIWHSLPLANHFRLSAELTFNFFGFSQVRSYQSLHPRTNPQVRYKSTHHQKITGQSFSLPVKLQIFFKKNGKLSLSLGAGISHQLSADLANTFVSQFEGFPSEKGRSFKVFADWEEFETTFNFNTGIHYRLDPHTSLGIEYIHEKSGSKDLFSFYPDYIFCDCDCGCDGYYARPRPNINSFSVSLRHNILR